jgi:hypothetical protein
MAWLIESGPQGEIEPDERRFLTAAVGQAEDQDLTNAFWRIEGWASWPGRMRGEAPGMRPNGGSP